MLNVFNSKCAALTFAVLVVAIAAPLAVAVPVIVEPGVTLAGSWSVNDVYSVAVNPLDGMVYAGERTSSGGIWRLNADATTTKVLDSEKPLGITFDPANGNMFVAEDGDGILFRATPGATVMTSWVSEFGDASDDDPAGIAIIPGYYTGGVLPVGTGLCTDRGYLGADELWQFLPNIPGGESLIVDDFSTLNDPFDIVVTSDRIIVIDGVGNGDGLTGSLFELVVDGAGFALADIATTTQLQSLRAGAWDPATGDLLVATGDSDAVLRVDLESGDVTTMITGVDVQVGSLAYASDTNSLYVGSKSEDTVYEFIVPEPASFSLLLCGLIAFKRKR